jgi:uncharacterized membrane protein HdeD (DUF308 family)
LATDEIPSALKHPLSLQADYASPTIYGWAGILVGILVLVLAAVMMVVFVVASMVFLAVVASMAFLAVGAIFVAVGYLILKTGK